MKHPLYPDREIRHGKLLTDVGFTIDMKWYDNHTPVTDRELTNVDKLIYWKRGDIRVTYFDYQQISINNLITNILHQAEYQMKRIAKITFEPYLTYLGEITTACVPRFLEIYNKDGVNLTEEYRRGGDPAVIYNTCNTFS